MKRPLCYLAIIITVIVYLYLEICSSNILSFSFDKKDGEYTEIVGKVSDKEYRLDYFGSKSLVLYVIPNDIKSNSFKYVQCYLSSDDDPAPFIGQVVKIRGKTMLFPQKRNPGEFDSHLYYAIHKISYRIKDAKIVASGGKGDILSEKLFDIRYYLEGILDRSLQQEDSAVMKAILLGDKSFMDSEIKELYKDNGIIHILAVSGLHISIIGMGLYRLLRRLRLGNVTSVIFSVILMYFYGKICGMGPSSARAIIMFAVRLMAPLLGRSYDLLSALALSAIMLILDQPLFLYDSGFLFSFGAVMGIAVIKPLIEPFLLFTGKDHGKMQFAEEKNQEKAAIYICFERLDKYLRSIGKIIAEGILSGLSIFITTLPVYALFYYTYPVHSLILNLMIIPVMGILMLSGMACMLIGAFALWFMGIFTGKLGAILFLLVKIPGVMVHIILDFFWHLCSGSFFRREFTWYMGHSEKWQVILYLLLVAAFVVLSLRVHSCGDLLRGSILVIAVMVLTIHIKPELAIAMIDVGQGDGIVISCKNKHMLIDGGSTSKKDVGKYQIIPFLKYSGIGMLDLVVMTHEDEDHISGMLEIMDDMEKGGIVIKQLILPEVSKKSRGDNYQRLEKRALELEIPVAYINAGESFKLGRASFLCLNPQKNMVTEGANAYSTVLHMKYGSFTALFTGDMEEEGLENVKNVLKSLDLNSITLLKVAHHGSKYTNDEEFLELLCPKLSLISCGIDNRYNHPHEEVLERLDNIHSKIYRTDESGEIKVLLKKGKVSIEGYCGL